MGQIDNANVLIAAGSVSIQPTSKATASTLPINAILPAMSPKKHQVVRILALTTRQIGAASQQPGAGNRQGERRP